MQDMAALRDYIASDSSFHAKRFIQRIFDHVEKLATYPELGRRVPEVDRNDIRELVYQGYRIIYRVSQAEVVILTVLHGSRDLSNPANRPWEA